MKTFMQVLSSVLLQLVFAVCIYYLSWPGFTRLRMGLSVVMIFGLWLCFLKSKKSFLKLSTLFLSFILLFEVYQFNSYRGVIMHAPKEVTKELGRHFIVGYHQMKDLDALIEQGAIGGIFVSGRNIQGKNFEQVRQELFSVQEKYKRLHGRALMISTDQEGGIVDKLSPLVPAQEPLSSLLIAQGSVSELKLKIQKYALTQALALKELGVNVNFSPVVDLKPKQPKDFVDTKTLIDQRAISDDPKQVSLVATIYSQTLLEYGISPTLKHFPGIGNIKQDTHFKIGELDLSKEELQAQDWIPFREVLSHTSAWLMLGHVKLKSIDERELVSLSAKVVDSVLRQEWNYSGIIVTDDFSMGPIYSRNGGVGKASVDALNAGVDYVLISYDPDLYYEAMASLIKAYERRELNSIQLEKSRMRIDSQLLNK